MGTASVSAPDPARRRRCPGRPPPAAEHGGDDPSPAPARASQADETSPKNARSSHRSPAPPLPRRGPTEPRRRSPMRPPGVRAPPPRGWKPRRDARSATARPRRRSQDEQPRSPGGGSRRGRLLPRRPRAALRGEETPVRFPVPPISRAAVPTTRSHEAPAAERLGTIPSRCPNATPMGRRQQRKRPVQPPISRAAAPTRRRHEETRGDTRRHGAGPQGASGRSVPGAHAPLSRGGGDLCACARRPTDRPPAAPAGRIHETRAGARTSGRPPPAPARCPPTGRRESAGAEKASQRSLAAPSRSRLRSRDWAPESRVSGSRSARRPASPTPAPRPYRR